MRVLVTGAAGSIGRVLVPGLVERGHEVVAVDLVPQPEGGPLVPWHVADCADPVQVAAVLDADPVDAVVHLAGIPDEASLSDSLTSHVVTTAALLDAMVARGGGRFVYASSNHAVGMTPRSESIGVDVRPRPDTFYGVAKVAAEAVLSLYGDRHGIDAVSCRIGSFLERPVTRRHLSTWLSHDDCVRMVDAALTCSAPGFGVLYGISANTRAWWDLAPGRSLGFEPQDDAEAWAEAIQPRPEDEAEAARVGGPFAGAERTRPAF
jgi:uronate dehydrogenase